MKSPYRVYLDLFFNRVIDLRHSALRISTILRKDVELLANKEIKFISGSSLIISDWTGPTDNGWEINFHTGIQRTTLNENYRNEVTRIISSECCLAYAQAFEALEKYLKDCVFHKLTNDQAYREMIKCEVELIREKMPGGDVLFKWTKKACGESFNEFSGNNNKNVKFKQFWSVLSEVRHAITHSNSNINRVKIDKSSYHLAVFTHLFDYSIIDDGVYHVKLDYKRLDRALKYVAEFSYQIYKCLSINEGVDWENVSYQHNSQ